MTDSTPAAAAGEEVVITRVFDATRERVFRAWTVPEEMAAWYGPEHFDTPRERIHIDLRVGGRYELTMVQRDDGAEFAIGYDIIELVEPELIVLRSDPMPEMGMHEPTITRVDLHARRANPHDPHRRPLPRNRTRRGRLARRLRQARDGRRAVAAEESASSSPGRNAVKQPTSSHRRTAEASAGARSSN